MKIGIVGCGQVGSSIAYACVLRGIGTEMLLVDANHTLAAAQAEDISHATPFAKSMPITSGTYADLHGCGIVIISAGVNQKPSETRLDLLKRNADVFSEIIPLILAAAPESILLIATNPVDIMTHMAAKISAKIRNCPGKVIGSGTILDTARFRTLLAKHLKVSSHSVHAHVLGEHGDSEVLNWSGANISNIGMAEFSERTGILTTVAIRQQIDEGVRRAAYRIIQGKGATWHGIGAGMARIAQAIVEDEHSVVTCCAPLVSVEGIADITLSIPHIISAQGALQSVYPTLDEAERSALEASAKVLKDVQNSINV